MIRDLLYPEDARKVIEALHSGLQYDAAIAVLGNRCSAAPLAHEGPDLSTPLRYGGAEADKAVRREAQALLSQFSLIAMVSRFEVHAQSLLLQRLIAMTLALLGNQLLAEFERESGPGFAPDEGTMCIRCRYREGA